MTTIALIGGEPMSRVVMACRLRRLGLSVFTELGERKRAKMFAKAQQEAATVYDLDKTEDQEELCYILRFEDRGRLISLAVTGVLRGGRQPQAAMARAAPSKNYR